MTFTPQAGLWGQRWNEISTDRRYALRHLGSAFVALFIPGLWAQAQELGERKTRAGAIALCERHTPDITGLAKGL